MSIFSKIRRESARGIAEIFILVLISLMTIGWSALRAADTGELSAPSIALATLCFLALLRLTHMSRRISVALDNASVSEAVTTRILQTDTLTGAVSRKHFLETLKESIGKPLAPKQVCLILIDVDHFKQINDSFGHPAGDAVLCHVVSKVKSIFSDATVGRLGGDEFAILARNRDLQLITARANALIESLRHGIVYDGQRLPISISMGLAQSLRDANQAKDLMTLADLALYESKLSGRGRITQFNGSMLSGKRHRRFIERELRAAIYLNELELRYQPIINSDGYAYALEGLVRWRHQVRGLIPPSEFVPVAEESNLIDALGAWVFKRACLDAPHFPNCRISINVSGAQLQRDEFVQMLRRVIAETEAKPEWFVLEITETTAMTATPDLLRRIETARHMGFRVALDDFGTGFCGFNYLKTLPVDAIKIDKSYVQSLGEDEVARVVVSALTQIASIQNLSIVAEGIETEDHMTLAKAAGCTRFQGYYIAKPAPLEQLKPLLRNPMTAPSRSLGAG